jgi:hypothetical protein
VPPVSSQHRSLERGGSAARRATIDELGVELARQFEVVGQAADAQIEARPPPELIADAPAGVGYLLEHRVE